MADRTQSNTSPEELKQQKDYLSEMAEEDRRALTWVMSDPRGRWFVWRLLDKTHVFTPTWDHSGSMMAKKAGMQEWGLTILHSLWDTCVIEYHKMQAEYLKHREMMKAKYPPKTKET